MKFQLEIDSVIKSYSGKNILSDVSLNCKIGDIIGIFGRNGSGKSTLLKIIYGTLCADNKFVRLNNKFSNKLFTIKEGISYLPQNNFIPNNFSVNKAIHLMIEKKLIQDFYQDDFIKEISSLRIRELSTGELKYLQVKLILCSKSKFCLLDEPYSGVSPIISEMINKQVVRQSQHKGIIITDHNYSYLLDIVSKIYLLNNGSGKFLRDKQELVTFGYLKNYMLK